MSITHWNKTPQACVACVAASVLLEVVLKVFWPEKSMFNSQASMSIAVQDLSSEAQKKAQPAIDNVRAKAAEAQSKAGDLQAEAQRKAQPVFDSAKEQYQQAEKQALKAKDDAIKQAQPVIDDAQKKASDVFFLVLLLIVAVYLYVYCKLWW